VKFEVSSEADRPMDQFCETKPIGEVSSVKCQVSSERTQSGDPLALKTPNFTLQTAAEPRRTKPIFEAGPGSGGRSPEVNRAKQTQFQQDHFLLQALTVQRVMSIWRSREGWKNKANSGRPGGFGERLYERTQFLSPEGLARSPRQKRLVASLQTRRSAFLGGESCETKPISGGATDRRASLTRARKCSRITVFQRPVPGEVYSGMGGTAAVRTPVRMDAECLE
jgi:hypothetical protein